MMYGRAIAVVALGFLAFGLIPVSGLAQCYFLSDPLEKETALLMQPPPKDMISMVGATEVQVRPTVLRMYVELWSKAESLEKALEQFPSRRQAVLKELERLGADKNSIVITDPSLENAWEEKKAYCERAISNGDDDYWGRGGGMFAMADSDEPGKIPDSVVVSALVTADWRLTGENPLKKIAQTQALQKRIKAADFGTLGELLPKEETFLSARVFGAWHGAVKPGHPYLIYVARISNQQREQAVRKAFESAQTQAARLARATGRELGPLAGLSSIGGRMEDRNTFSSYWDHPQLPWELAAKFTEPDVLNEDRSTQAMGVSLDPLTFKFYVKACFRLTE